MSRLSSRTVLLLGVVAMFAAASSALASDDDAHERHEKHERDEHRHEAMRHAVERGQIKSLVEVLKIVQPHLPGEIVGVEAEFKNGVWLYEFRVLDKNGRLFETYVDAATAEITKIEAK